MSVEKIKKITSLGASFLKRLVTVDDFNKKIDEINTALDNTGTGITVETDISANGGTQGTATALTATYNKVTTVGEADYAVKLPAATATTRVVVLNAAATAALHIFPSSGDNYEGLSDNSKVALEATSQLEVICFEDGIWTIL